VSELVEGYWCPITETAKLLGKKWYPVIIHRLLSGPKRFGELKELIPDISAKVLSDSLEELEKTGLVTRSVESTRPVLIRYSLNEKGVDLKGVLQKMSEWGSKWLAPMEKAILTSHRR
jgi:DNA-binding HxlR family transcriptional regulator